MKNRFTLVLISFCAAIALTPSLFANECPMGKGKMSMRGMTSRKMDFENMFFRKIYFILANKDALGLNDAQVEKVLSIKYAAKKNVIQKETEIKLLALDMMEELRKDEINIPAINSLLDKKYDAKKQKAKQFIDSYITLKAVLTKEQHKKLKDMRDNTMGKGMRKHCPMMEEKEKHMMPKTETESE